MTCKLTAHPLAPVIAGVLALAGVVAFSDTAHAQSVTGDCSGTTISILPPGQPAFVLPERAGQTVEVAPGDQVPFVVSNPPEAGVAEIAILLPFGNSLREPFDWDGVPPGRELRFRLDPVAYLPADGLPADAIRGVLDIEITLFSFGRFICSIPFKVKVGEFGGPVSTGVGAAAAAAGVVALAGTIWSTGATRAKVKVKVAMRRRRPTGWRRWVPVPAWRKTAAATIMGVITGELVAVVLQQAGVAPLTTRSVIASAIAGGGVAVGVSIGLGAIWTYLRPPEDDPDTPPLQA